MVLMSINRGGLKHYSAELADYFPGKTHFKNTIEVVRKMLSYNYDYIQYLIYLKISLHKLVYFTV